MALRVPHTPDPRAFVVHQLSMEFGDQVDPQTIQEVATHEVSQFDGAKVRDFVPIIAWRLARARLLEELRYGNDRMRSNAI